VVQRQGRRAATATPPPAGAAQAGPRTPTSARTDPARLPALGGQHPGRARGHGRLEHTALPKIPKFVAPAILGAARFTPASTRLGRYPRRAGWPSAPTVHPKEIIPNGRGSPPAAGYYAATPERRYDVKNNYCARQLLLSRSVTGPPSRARHRAAEARRPPPRRHGTPRSPARAGRAGAPRAAGSARPAAAGSPRRPGPGPPRSA
jgi:hypothetical protein